MSEITTLDSGHVLIDFGDMVDLRTASDVPSTPHGGRLLAFAAACNDGAWIVRTGEPRPRQRPGARTPWPPADVPNKTAAIAMLTARAAELAAPAGVR